MCRENAGGQFNVSQLRETSLHVQRKPTSCQNPLEPMRNISACAEKTLVKSTIETINEKHLCMCRENHRIDILALIEEETSLHVQRKHKGGDYGGISEGNISACAEKTRRMWTREGLPKKHLCMCRENASMS